MVVEIRPEFANGALSHSPDVVPQEPYLAMRRLARFCAIEAKTLLSWLACCTLKYMSGLVAQALDQGRVAVDDADV